MGAGGQRCLQRGTVCARAEVSEAKCLRWVLLWARPHRDSVSPKEVWGQGSNVSFCFSNVERV